MDRVSTLLAVWRINRTFPLLVGSLILLNVLAYVLLNFIVLPQSDLLEKELLDLQARIRQARQSDGEMKTPAEIFSQGRADLEKFRATIPAKTELPALVGDVSALAGQAGLAIDNIVYQPKELEGQGLLRYGLAFSVHGEYGQVKRFIYSLEQSERLIVIDGITLSGSREPGLTKVELHLQLATFFRMDAS